ncbi:hypothetical protein PoB_000070000 [Plakobranchus ocellatus]|uniref:Uncharacterized protein n=1 Tax=Plakobranchus ocellatus TaxID=259542 RepID=A0AAV3XTE5_9GAST|nr:hypothetical protein PoB_000070000 [Plakobranchus ocellatus]
MAAFMRKSEPIFGTESCRAIHPKRHGKGNTTRVEPLMVHGKANSTDRKEADAFTKHFSKVNKITRDLVAYSRLRRLKKALECRPTASNRTLKVEFTENKLYIALLKGRTGKALGQGGITQKILTHLGSSAKGALFNLFNRTWRSGELPRAWRTAVFVPILKKGKCVTAAESYRPISLTSVISKTMERMVNARLYH